MPIPQVTTDNTLSSRDAILFTRNCIVGYTERTNSKFATFSSNLKNEVFGIPPDTSLPLTNTLLSINALDLYLIEVIDPDVLNELFNSWELIEISRSNYIKLQDYDIDSTPSNPEIGTIPIPLSTVMMVTATTTIITKDDTGASDVPVNVGVDSIIRVGPLDETLSNFILINPINGQVALDTGDTFTILVPGGIEDDIDEIKEAGATDDEQLFIISGFTAVFRFPILTPDTTYPPGEIPEIKLKTVIAVGLYRPLS